MSEYKSTDEIIKNIKETAEEVVEDLKETVEEVVEDVKETVEEVVEDVKEIVEEAEHTGKFPLMKLKEENPKVFFGSIAAIMVVAGLFFFSGGSSKTQHLPRMVYSVGETYTLQALNAIPGAGVTLKILKIPGQIASFDNESEDVVCNAPTGTRATIKSFQEAFGKKKLFAHIEILDAVNDCRQGVKGWTLTTNMK